jgi:hypothetical protein
MPQLPKDVAKRTAEAESGWDMEEGIYVVALKAVHDADPKTKKVYEGDKGPYWNWVVEFPKTGPAAEINENRYKGRQLWRSISLSESADNMRQEAYTAFGDPTASVNTDELIGNFARVETYNDEWDGQLRAKVRKFMPLDAETAAKLGEPTTEKGKAAKKATTATETLY